MKRAAYFTVILAIVLGGIGVGQTTILKFLGGIWKQGKLNPISGVWLCYLYATYLP